MRAVQFDLEVAFLRIARRGLESLAGGWTVAIASAAVFFILSLGNGLSAYLSERLMEFTPALWVEDFPSSPAGAISGDPPAGVIERLAAHPGVAAVARSVESTVLVTRSSASAGAKLAAYDANALAAVLRGARRSVTGRLPQAPGEAALGADLAKSLGVRLGDDIALTGPGGASARVRVVGLVRAGFAAVDAALVLAAFEDAARVAGAGGRYGFAVAVQDGVDLERLRLELQSASGRWVQPWYEGRQALLEAVEVESRVMFWITLATVAAAALGSSGVAFLRTVEQSGETGVLLALGASPANILRTSLAESVFAACAASVAGALLGLGAVHALARYPVRLPAEFGLEHLPLEPSWSGFLTAAGLTVVAASAAAVIPAFRAARTDPAAVLRER